MESFALSSFVSIMGAAFVGGLILNVMPCVLPVLALKFYALSQSKQERAGSLWLVAGIFFSFFAFAVLVYVLQQVGVAVGWGFHFQQPIFILAMMTLLLFFALASGRFSFGLENRATHFLTKLEGKNAGVPANLFYGALIVLLATPCTAPFLGTALAFALTQGLLTIVAIFTAIALGLALPWFAFALFPSAAQKMLARVQGGPAASIFSSLTLALLYGSALWLLFVLMDQIGTAPALLSFVALHGILFFSQRLRFATPVLVALVLALPLVLPAPPPAPTLATTLPWQPFNERAIKIHTAQGKKVFVDITAKWCITCQFNKTNVLWDKQVSARLKQSDIVLMQGDLTRPNPRLLAYLKKNGRIGIPFNALYDQGGIHLFSELLDKKTLLTQLNK